MVAIRPQVISGFPAAAFRLQRYCGITKPVRASPVEGVTARRPIVPTPLTPLALVLVLVNRPVKAVGRLSELVEPVAPVPVVLLGVKLRLIVQFGFTEKVPREVIVCDTPAADVN